MLYTKTSNFKFRDISQLYQSVVVEVVPSAVSWPAVRALGKISPQPEAKTPGIPCEFTRTLSYRTLPIKWTSACRHTSPPHEKRCMFG